MVEFTTDSVDTVLDREKEVFISFYVPISHQVVSNAVF
jgi:hypothetical protein